MESHLPFEIDRSSDTSLISQVVDGLRRAIVFGAYPIGTTLPTFREIADGLGVSMNVVRTAMKQLSYTEGSFGSTFAFCTSACMRVESILSPRARSSDYHRTALRPLTGK